MRAAEDDSNPRMSRFQSPRFIDSRRELARHTPNADHPNAAIPNEMVYRIRRNSLYDHIEDMHLEAGLPQPCSEVDVVKRNVLDEFVKRRRRSDERKHLTLIVADSEAVS